MILAVESSLKKVLFKIEVEIELGVAKFVKLVGLVRTRAVRGMTRRRNNRRSRDGR